jgi:hypothetical protein
MGFFVAKVLRFGREIGIGEGLTRYLTWCTLLSTQTAGETAKESIEMQDKTGTTPKAATTETNYAGHQPRISTAEKQQAANNPRPFGSDQEKPLHPGFTDDRDMVESEEW